MKRRKTKRKPAPPARRKRHAAADRGHPHSVTLEVFAPATLAIEYTRGGKAYRHQFSNRPTLYRSKDGKTLVIYTKTDKWIHG